MTRTEFHDPSPNAADDPPSDLPAARRPLPAEASLRRLEDYIRRDETSLARQRRIIGDCDGPARAIAEATVAEYEQSLQALYRRRAKLLARS